MNTSPLPYKTEKKFMSSSHKADGAANIPVADVALRLVAGQFSELIFKVMQQSQEPAALVNIQGAHAEDMFYAKGVIKTSPDNDASKNNQEYEIDPDGEAIPFELQILSKLKTVKERTNYIFEVTTVKDGCEQQMNAQTLHTLFSNPQLHLSALRLSIEWLSPHYFSWLGLAPSIEDFVHVVYVGSTKRLEIRYGGDNISDTVASPIKDQIFWQQFSAIIKNVGNGDQNLS